MRRDDAELPNGNPCIREVVEHPGGVCVAALTEDDELIFVRQFRYPYMEVILELPAGKLERGEDPLESGKRELLEEIGCTADEYINLGKFYPTCGYVDEIIEPQYSRERIIKALDMLKTKKQENPHKKHGNIPL